MTKEELTAILATYIVMLNDTDRQYSVEAILSKCYNLYTDNQG